MIEGKKVEIKVNYVVCGAACECLSFSHGQEFAKCKHAGGGIAFSKLEVVGKYPIAKPTCPLVENESELGCDPLNKRYTHDPILDALYPETIFERGEIFDEVDLELD